MIKRILVGLDGSKISNVAAEYGIYLSKKLKRPVVGIHIIDIRLLEGPFLEDIAGALGFATYADLTPKIKEVLDEKAKVILDAFAKKCREEGGDCSIAQAYGIVADEIVNMSDPDDLIIVGKKGEHPEFIPLLLGSTAEAISRKAPCPVMITTDKFKEIKKVVLAFDGREKSIHAVKYVNSFEKDLGLDYVHVITVLEDKNDTEKKKHIEELLKENLNLNYDIEYLEGYPEEELSLFIENNSDKYDLVVMGAYGESRIKELILGSTTSYIMSKTTIPLLLVK